MGEASERAMAVIDEAPRSLAVFSPRSVDEIVRQAGLIQELYKKLMHDGEHYGTIPGTQKPSLWKPGAEMLCSTFRVYADFVRTEDTILEKDFILWDFRCDLYDSISGRKVGSGRGSCNSREEKYGFRFQNRACPSCGKETVIAGKAEYGGGFLCYAKKGGCGSKFKDDDPAILSQSIGKIPNENIWDICNTLEKMACKRSLVAAALITFGCSDIFTQDVEDFIDDANAATPFNNRAKQQAQQEKAQREASTAPTSNGNGSTKLGAKGADELKAEAKKHGINVSDLWNRAKNMYPSAKSLTDLTHDQAKAVMSELTTTDAPGSDTKAGNDAQDAKEPGAQSQDAPPPETLPNDDSEKITSEGLSTYEQIAARAGIDRVDLYHKMRGLWADDAAIRGVTYGDDSDLEFFPLHLTDQLDAWIDEISNKKPGKR